MVWVLLYTLTLAPLRSEADTLFRSQLSDAIARGTDDERERIVLARLAWYEGSYSRRVASCAVKGDNGRSLGIFQVQPRSPLDRAEACGTLDAQVRVALRFMRRSVDVCRANTGSAVLNLYTSGSCERGHAASKDSWEQLLD